MACELKFASAHETASGDHNDPLLVVPAGQTFTIQSAYLQKQTAGEMLEIQSDGNDYSPIAHIQADNTASFDNLNANVTGTIYMEVTGQGNNQHSFAYIEYAEDNCRGNPYYANYVQQNNLAALSWLSLLILESAVFFTVLYFFYKQFKK